MAFFAGLVFTENGACTTVAHIGGESFYVVDDNGFRRHIEARPIDRYVLNQFAEQLRAHRDEAAEAMLRMMGQADPFTKAAVDSSLDNLDIEPLLNQTLPSEAGQWLGMLGFRIIIDMHGDVVHVDLPSATDGWDEE
jgi:hypothetical protein